MTKTKILSITIATLAVVTIAYFTLKPSDGQFSNVPNCSIYNINEYTDVFGQTKKRKTTRCRILIFNSSDDFLEHMSRINFVKFNSEKINNYGFGSGTSEMYGLKGKNHDIIQNGIWNETYLSVVPDTVNGNKYNGGTLAWKKIPSLEKTPKELQDKDKFYVLHYWTKIDDM